MSHHPQLRVAAAALLLLLSFSLPLAVAHGQITVGAGIVERRAAPGESYGGSIPVTNGTAVDRRVRIYQSDYSFRADGRNSFADPGTLPRSNARWVTVGPLEVDVPAGATVDVRYSVAVPTAPAAPGSYWSTVMIEEVPAGAMARGAARVALGVRQVMRTAVVLVTTLDGGRRALSFERPQLLPGPGGARHLDVDLVNTGERAERPEVSVELFDERGTSVGRFAGKHIMLYPGTSTRERVDFGAVKAGRYTAVVLGDAGGDAVFAAHYRLAF